MGWTTRNTVEGDMKTTAVSSDREEKIQERPGMIINYSAQEQKT
jgi:hypothetical protein